jgi:hypothetical protein
VNATPSSNSFLEAASALGSGKEIMLNLPDVGPEHVPVTWNHVIEKESLNFTDLEHVLIEKVEQLF